MVFGLTREQVREIDRRATAQYHIPSIVLMENAALSVVSSACDALIDCPGCSVMVACGGGNNGGDGLAVARHLHNRGFEVRIELFTDPSRFKGDALVNWRIIEAMRVSASPAEPRRMLELMPALLIDAVFGTGLSRPIENDTFTAFVHALGTASIPVLSVDVPSGLDCQTGQPLGPCVRATRTVTFVAQKVGFASPQARGFLGTVSIGDIGCPRRLIDEVVRDLPG
jgi:NAD(P)H-hydrate epimerase